MDAKVCEALKFSGDQMEESIISIDSILFCGRSIPFEKPRNFRAVYGEQRLLLSLLKSNNDSEDSFKRQLSFSLQRHPTGSGGSRSNSATSKSIWRYGSGSPRKYKSILGVTKKLQSEMDMNDIKRRQSHQVPTPLVPPAFFNDQDGVVTGRVRGRHWGLLRCSANLVNALSRASLGCIPHV